jgi:glutaredoxin
MKIIKFFGTNWCGDCKRARRILNDRKVEYIFIDVDKDKDGEAFVKSTNQGSRRVPTIVFFDDTILVEPSNQELNNKLDALGL